MNATRRSVLAAGGAAAVGTLTGCSTEAGQDEPAGEATDATVSMAPVGDVTLEDVPENVANYFPGYADMAVALGHGDAITSVGLTDRYYTFYYDDLDGVTFEKGDTTELVTDNGIDKEVFYELDSDLHLIDPEWLVNNGAFGFEQADVDDLETDVAPFLGNTIFRRTDPWHDYRYYTLYEAFEKVAEVFDERERFDAFEAFHDDVLAGVQADLPAANERPDALLCFSATEEPEAFSPYRLTDQGTNKKQFHDLGIADALAGTGIDGLSTDDRGQIDYETMLDVDPDSILVRGHETTDRQAFEDTVLAFMESHEVASELTAVQEGRVFRGGPIYAGPIQNLFLTERFTQLYFPETFDDELFDRDELASIVTGE